jgi:transketolase
MHHLTLQITIDGSTELSFSEDVLARYAAYGWHTQTVGNVSELTTLEACIDKARSVTDKPSIIKVRTKIGHGSKLEGSEKTHGAPLGAEDVSSMTCTCPLV